MIETTSQAALIALGVFLVALVGLTAWKASQHRSPPITEGHPGEAQTQGAVNGEHGPPRYEGNAEQAAPANQSKPSQQVRNRPNGAEQEKENHEAALAKYTYWLTAFTAILAVATVALVIATAGLWGYAAEQATDMKHSIQESRRSADAARKGPLGTIYNVLFARRYDPAVSGFVTEKDYTDYEGEE